MQRTLISAAVVLALSSVPPEWYTVTLKIPGAHRISRFYFPGAFLLLAKYFRNVFKLK